MKYVLLRPEQLIFDTEEEAINHYRNPQPMTPEERWTSQHMNAAGGVEPEKVLVCKVECLQVIKPSIALSEGGDAHFVDYEEAERKRAAEVRAGGLAGRFEGAAMGPANRRFSN